MTRASAKSSFGASLWLAASGGALVKVADLLNVDPPKFKRAMQDATTHDSVGGAEEVIPEGTYDPGDINFQALYVAGSAGDAAMIGYMVDATYVDWKIVPKASSGTQDLTGSGYLTEYGPDPLPVKGKQVASGSLKVSGERAQGASA